MNNTIALALLCFVAPAILCILDYIKTKKQKQHDSFYRAVWRKSENG